MLMTPGGKAAFKHTGAAAWDGQRTRDFLKQLAGAQGAAPAVAPVESPTEQPAPAANTAAIPVSAQQ